VLIHQNGGKFYDETGIILIDQRYSKFKPQKVRGIEKCGQLLEGIISDTENLTSR
jgi:hypothetical protein